MRYCTHYYISNLLNLLITPAISYNPSDVTWITIILNTGTTLVTLN